MLPVARNNTERKRIIGILEFILKAFDHIQFWGEEGGIRFGIMISESLGNGF
jgi:hypothetical protein